MSAAPSSAPSREVPHRQQAVRAMPFQTAHERQSQRRSIGMWLAESGSSPYPAPQLQHVSRSSSFGTPQSRQVQARGEALSARTWRATETATVTRPDRTEEAAETKLMQPHAFG